MVQILAKCSVSRKITHLCFQRQTVYRNPSFKNTNLAIQSFCKCKNTILFQNFQFEKLETLQAGACDQLIRQHCDTAKKLSEENSLNPTQYFKLHSHCLNETEWRFFVAFLQSAVIRVPRMLVITSSVLSLWLLCKLPLVPNPFI